ncbi:MAG: glycosyltransferase [Clostridiales bacterium]|nr:glycosyltransferase [Clostridiales bacterium]
MKVSLIIPMYNEASIIDGAIETFGGFLKSKYEDFELIFVSDGSVDGCADAVKKAAESDSRIKLCEYSPNRGKGYAVRTGMLAATGDVCIFTDCDNAYGEEAVGRLADMFESTDFDIIVGSRNLSDDGYKGYTFIRKLASKIYIKVIAIAAGFKLSDSQCGIKGFRNAAAKKIFSNCEVDRWAFDLEAIMIATKLKYKIGEMPVTVINHRESKIHVLSDSVKMLRDVGKMKKRIRKADIK